MKQSIVAALFVAMVCSIAQPGYAADFTLNIGGVQIYKLPSEVTGVYLICELLEETHPGNLVKRAERSARLQKVSANTITLGPMRMTFDNVPQKERITKWRCSFRVEANGKFKNVVPCAPSPENFNCIDTSQYNKAFIQGDITP